MRILFVLTILICCYSCNQRAKPRRNSTSAKDTTLAMGCAPAEVADKSWYGSNKKALLFAGLKGINYPISSGNLQAQTYFNQGLMLSFGFNHAEAARSFYESIRQDSTCGMCWWGLSYVLGPNYNGGMEKDNFQRAFDAAQKAKSNSNFCSVKEKALINALSSRYSLDTSITRSMLDEKYAKAMRKVHETFPTDVTIATLLAESLMDLHPWDLWKKNGVAQAWTPGIIELLTISLAKEPQHVGANHFYIHATEMSQHPEVAMKSAELLRELVPGSGHLVHMPSHVYILTGKYHEGVLSNIAAAKVDSNYLDACHANGMYPLSYYPHNYHFLAACATLDGESKLAMQGAIATARHAEKKLLRDPEWSTLQHYYTIPWYVSTKLGLWKYILQSTKPANDLSYPLVIWHYAQGMAMLAADDTIEAARHLAEINKLMTDPNLKQMSIWRINNLLDLCKIASKVLRGEIQAKGKKFTEAVLTLKEALQIELSLNYDEPPDWFFSVRHNLGAVLIDAGKPLQAIEVYKMDLKNFKENGWALKGLMNAYEKLSDKENYLASKMRFEKSWKYADIQITTSRILEGHN